LGYAFSCKIFLKIYELQKEEMPSPWFAFFISKVLKSTTQCRAKIVEKSYERMTTAGVSKILDIHDSKELDQLCLAVSLALLP